MDKKQFRAQMSEKRGHLSDKQVLEYSNDIAHLLFESDLYKRSENICVYQAFRKEVSCDAIMKRAFTDRKRVYVPVTDLQKKTMDFYQVTRDTVWKAGSYGILEPEKLEPAMQLKEKALILMPGLLFDKNKRRIGYGGGYYDKYLFANKEHITVALCYDFQIVDYDLPVEEHDILPDYILTNKNMI